MKKLLASVWLLGGFIALPGFAQEYYRYKNESGQTVMDTKIPAEYVNAGYDVLNSRGQLVERVMPVQNLDSQADEQASQVANRALSDQVLLTSYSSVDEIDAHRLRKLQGVEREISIIETDERAVLLELDKTTAEIDRLGQGQEIPADLSEQLADLKNTMAQLEEQWLRRKNELAEIDKEFLGKIERFRQLKAELPQR